MTSEIEFCHGSKISRITFSENDISVNIEFAEKIKKALQEEDAFAMKFPSLNTIRFHSPENEWMTIFGNVHTQKIKSLLYSTFNGFTLLLKDTEDNSILIEIKVFILHLHTTQIKRLFDLLYQYVYPVIATNVLNLIAVNGHFSIDGIKIYGNGLELDRNRIFKNDKTLVNWNSLCYELKGNSIFLMDRNSNSVKSEIRTTTENACIIPFIIDTYKANYREINQIL